VNAPWYAVYTRFQHEKSAAALLSQKEFEVFLPLYRSISKWKDRNQLVVLPLFPCYLFVKTEQTRKAEILRTTGVVGLVENSGRACAVPEDQIDAVRRICSLATRFQPHPFVKLGDRVRIRKGPLVGMEGLYVRTKTLDRVVVSVELLRQSVAVEVDMTDIEPVHRIRGNPASAPNIVQKTA